MAKPAVPIEGASARPGDGKMSNNRTAKAGNWEEIASGSFKARTTPRIGNWLEKSNTEASFVNLEFYDMTSDLPCIVNWKIRGLRGSEGFHSFKIDYDICISNGKMSSPSNYRGSIHELDRHDVAKIMQPAYSSDAVMSLLRNGTVPEFKFNEFGDSEHEKHLHDHRHEFNEIGYGKFDTYFESASRPSKDGKKKKCSIEWNMRRSVPNLHDSDANVMECSINLYDHAGLLNRSVIHGEKFLIDDALAEKILSGNDRDILEPLISLNQSIPKIKIGDDKHEPQIRLRHDDFTKHRNKVWNMNSYSIKLKNPLD